jgi:gamma-glutamylcyclotransferase (GGCT)/AIG2-like uncharacterized protein YtfP
MPDKDIAINKVFVYGSLKEGFHNHVVMEMAGGKLVATGITMPQWDMVSFGAYPGVIGNGECVIKGEVYEVEDLRPIDRLEGHPTFYERFVVDIACKEPVKAWMYVLPRETYGDYSDNFGIKTERNVKEWVGRNM